MAEPDSFLEDPAAPDEAAALRAELSRVRATAEAERRALEYELKLARSAVPTQHDPAAATQSIAGQQEIQALRNTLREKDRVIQKLTTQCSSLEDQLEDNFQQLDALRLRAKRRELQQAEATRRLEQKPRTPEPAKPTAVGRGAIAPPLPLRVLSGLIPGLVLGTTLTGATAAGLWWSGHWPAPRMPASAATASEAGAPAELGGEGAAGSAAGTSAESGAEIEAGRVIGAEPAQATSPVRGTVHDPNGPPMIALNPGTFRMGNTSGAGGSDTRPAHEVSLHGFLIGAREVSFAEYDRFVRATGARSPNDFGLGRGSQPVVDVTWADAVAFTRWLSRRTGKRYRLPTEAEWEYAARAGTNSLYWWGADAPAGQAVCFDCGSRFDRIAPAPVGFSGPNAFGLYDTAGNVYEWVADCYRPSYRDAPTDGTAVTQPGCRERVARGGSYKAPAKSMQVHARRGFEPDTHIDTIGFRVARDAR